jgi:haloalkane dehalogenase
MVAVTSVPAPDVMATFAAPRFLELPHGRLAYYRFGRGPDVVMVHGWPLHAATYRHVIPALAERYTLHLFDLPGTGHTTEWTGPISLWEHPATAPPLS